MPVHFLQDCQDKTRCAVQTTSMHHHMSTDFGQNFQTHPSKYKFQNNLLRYNTTLTGTLVMKNYDCWRSHRGPQPLHIPGLGRVGSQLLKAQGGRLRGEAGVLEQNPSLQAFLFEGLIVLVGEAHGLLFGAHSFCTEPVLVYTGRYPCSVMHSVGRYKYGGSVSRCWWV